MVKFFILLDLRFLMMSFSSFKSKLCSLHALLRIKMLLKQLYRNEMLFLNLLVQFLPLYTLCSFSTPSNIHIKYTE